MGRREIAELCYISARGLPLKILGVVSYNRRDNGFFGHHVFAANDIERLQYDAILV